MTAVATTEYQDYTVPRADGTALVQPSSQDLLANLGRPSFIGAPHGIEFCGKSLDLVREQARREILERALAFTGNYRDVDDSLISANATASLILSGHQPELFHPGVWFKNFLLSSLAAKSGSIAINFLVDNDLCRSTAIRVPTHDEADASTIARSVPFDTPRDSVPWELRRLGSLETWRDFPSAVKSSLAAGAAQPLLYEMWPEALEAVRRTDRPGLAIAQARHQLEQRLGLQTLEVPLSHLVSTRAFARFSIQLLSELPRFHECYNSQLSHFRSAHRIRSHAHPVPALEQTHGWLEAPWWVYRHEAPQRQALWVRVQDDQLILSDRAGWQAVIEGRLDCDNASSQWLDLLADGICLRPRALLTTMYLRIMASDLFIHGIGGGKYDQLTNGIVREFFGIEPAMMAVATATVHLPRATFGEILPAEDASDLEAERMAERERLWRLKYHADQLIAPSSAEFQTLSEKKKELLANIPARGEKWRWHREITAVNRRLSELAAHQAEQAKQRLEQVAVRERQNRILFSREYSFCLFPRDHIARQLNELASSH